MKKILLCSTIIIRISLCASSSDSENSDDTMQQFDTMTSSYQAKQDNLQRLLHDTKSLTLQELQEEALFRSRFIQFMSDPSKELRNILL